MAEQEWMRFERTGSVADYLAYSRAQGTGCAGVYTDSQEKESERKDGTDHCAYRYGVSGNTYRGL